MDTIKRENIIKAVALLGFDPHDVENVIIWPREVQVTLFERDEHGHKILDPKDGNRPKRRVEVCNVG